MTSEVQPAALRAAAALRTPASSSGVRTRPLASSRSSTSSLRSRGMTGRKVPVMP